VHGYNDTFQGMTDLLLWGSLIHHLIGAEYPLASWQLDGSQVGYPAEQ
jgi:hypothetical protein